jgi:alkyl hydroperoxide reductase subunit AhpF
MFTDERATDKVIKGFKIYGDKLFVYSKSHIANYDINRVNKKSKKELAKEKKEMKELIAHELANVDNGE